MPLHREALRVRQASGAFRGHRRTGLRHRHPRAFRDRARREAHAPDLGKLDSDALWPCRGSDLSHQGGRQHLHGLARQRRPSDDESRRESRDLGHLGDSSEPSFFRPGPRVHREGRRPRGHPRQQSLVLGARRVRALRARSRFCTLALSRHAGPRGGVQVGPWVAVVWSVRRIELEWRGHAASHRHRRAEADDRRWLRECLRA